MKKCNITGNYKPTNSDDIPLEAWEEHRKMIARVIVKYGDAYLPILARINQEIEKKKKRDNLLEQAYSLANDNLENCHTFCHTNCHTQKQ